MSSLSDIHIWKQKNMMRIQQWIHEVQTLRSHCVNDHWKTLLHNNVVAHDIPQPFNQFVMRDYFDIFIKHDAICEERWNSEIALERERLNEAILYAEAEVWRLHFKPEVAEAEETLTELQEALKYFESWVHFWQDDTSRYTFITKSIADISVNAWVPFLDGTSLEQVLINIDYFLHIAHSDVLMLQTLDMYPTLFYLEQKDRVTPYPNPLDLLHGNIIQQWNQEPKTTITHLFSPAYDGLVLHGL